MVDNFFKDCPAKMSDGRFLTDYRSATRREEYVKYINDIVRDDTYRLFLQGNADNILDNEWSYLRKNKSCWKTECIHNYPTRVYPAWFVEERVKYDSLSDPNRKVRYYCPPKADYRLTSTKGCK